MDGGFGFRQTLEQFARARPAAGAKGGAIDQGEDLRQRPVHVPGIVVVMMVPVMVVFRSFLDDKPRRGNTSAKHLVGPHLDAIECEAAEGGAQIGERQAGVEAGAEKHVARNAGEAVEIQQSRHQSRPISLKLQYRASPSTT
jgi:hypothetical protein